MSLQPFVQTGGEYFLALPLRKPIVKVFSYVSRPTGAMTCFTCRSRYTEIDISTSLYRFLPVAHVRYCFFAQVW